MKNLSLVIFISVFAVNLIFSSGCGGISNLSVVQGSGIAKSETRNVRNFDKIEANGAVNLEINAQKDFSFSIEADDNLLQNIKTEVSDNTLKIYSEGEISPKTPINVKISLPEIVGLDVNGASNAILSGATSDLIVLKANGASKIKIDGQVIKLKADASGASTIEAENMKAEDVDINANGASSASVLATEELHMDASGASKIFYVGEPKRIKQNASGASSISKK